VLIYKKGDTNDPANYTPITLQPVWYKVCSSVYATKMYDFLIRHKYIDTNMQKGFWKGVDGVTEHTEMPSHIIEDAKRNQRSIAIALLDLRNAFREVHHNLIVAAIRYHHLPKEFTDIFVNIYENNFITVAVNTEWTKSIKIDHGVLQGDPNSPLLFNMCFNTLMQTLDQPMYRKLGYTWGAANSTQQRG